MGKIITGIFLSLVTHLAFGQYILLGTAQEMMNGCIQLTPDAPYTEGIAYHEAKLNLENFFQIEFDIFLGNKNEGADGMTFVIHNDVREYGAFGTWGECMGYGRFNPFIEGISIDPSIAVEFDTYQNPWQGDPPSDHIAYLENGISLHETYWNDHNDAYNIEDDRLHSFYMRWDPMEKALTIILDGDIVYYGEKDIVKDIFKGETNVIWGFTASTGRAYNQQYFCLKRLASNK